MLNNMWVQLCHFGRIPSIPLVGCGDELGALQLGQTVLFPGGKLYGERRSSSNS